MTELYWMALLRDVDLATFATDPQVAAARQGAVHLDAPGRDQVAAGAQRSECAQARAGVQPESVLQSMATGFLVECTSPPLDADRGCVSFLQGAVAPRTRDGSGDSDGGAA